MTSQDPEALQGDTAQELRRLADQHYMIKDNMPQPLLCPINLASMPELRILDSGCANGLWLRDLAKIKNLQPSSGPHYTLIGADATAAFFPHDPPKNTIFINHAITNRWPEVLHGVFHVVHQRSVLAGLARTNATPRLAVHYLVETLAPGGWMQLVEMDLRPSSYSHSGPATKDMVASLRALMEAAGSNHTFAAEMKDWLMEEGLEDVREHEVDLRAGISQAKSEEARERAARVWRLNAETVARAAELIGADLEPGTTDNLAERLDKEINDIGGHLRLLVVVGRKKTGN
ncbi:hypothetical protein BDV97DRAFT_54223 [Delphinella strobiligena]|nr:hypothetical protein BDV97DRAFT_54223 [Delphinella strobiligena]